MRRALTAFALALSLLGCGSRDDEVSLFTDATESGDGCWLLHVVVDVFANPTFGTAVGSATGAPLTWPRGFTARRAGAEVEVLDRAGNVVLTTGGRYWLCPTPSSDYTKPISQWVIGEVRPCPDCALGGGPD
jgi:hypothetical protein